MGEKNLMTTGILWFDASDTALSVKIQKAYDYYMKKYGEKPNLCLVKSADFVQVDIEGLTVKPYEPVLRGHIWIGKDG